MIKAYYFNSLKPFAANNFGDMLVPLIFMWLTGEKVKFVPPNTEGKILCVGSEMAREGVLQKNDVVWGYGANTKKEIIIPDGVKLLAVRGHFTKKLIKNATPPTVVSDPGLLMPRIYEPRTLPKKHKVGLIPHYIDKGYFKQKDPSILNININDHVFNIIDQINSCEVIIATSMHGAIVAEAYGKPVVWLKVSNRVCGMEFKWNDYISGTGRDVQSPQTNKNISQIIDKTLPKPKINTDPLLKAWGDYYGNRP